MEDQNFLKYFINEEVYVIPGDVPATEITNEPKVEETVQVAEEKVEEQTSVEPVIVTTPTEAIKEEVNEKPEPAKEEEQKEPDTPDTPDYTPPVYSGHFIKGVLVVVHSKGLKFDHVDLLEKILGSIGMQKEDVAILPSGHMQSKEDFNWVNQVDKKQTFMFGLPDKWMQQFNSDITKYVNHKTEKGNLMFIDSLVELNNEVSLKKQLWAQLKSINV